MWKAENRMARRQFTVFNPFAGIYHVRDALSAHMTLLVGDKAALLFDTGYGLFDPLPMLRRITPLPLIVVLSHGHYDHTLGCCWFEEVYLPQGEEEGYRQNTGEAMRIRVLKRVADAGIPLTAEQRADYLAFSMPEPCTLTQQSFDLGGLHVRVWPMPGHTTGSVGLLVEERRLLLAGDNLNPVVWLFFKDCTSLAEYARTMRSTLYLPFSHAICPHADQPYERAAVEDYVEGLRPETYLKAKPVRIEPYTDIATCECVPAEGFKLVFDSAEAYADGSLIR
jgi:glyoxylase-like metal-dependent hydrolase (beta-lactamase superfamily II)